MLPRELQRSLDLYITNPRDGYSPKHGGKKKKNYVALKTRSAEMWAPHKFKRSPTIQKRSISEMRQGSGAGIHPQPALLRRRGQAAPGRGVRTAPPRDLEEASRIAQWN